MSVTGALLAMGAREPWRRQVRGGHSHWESSGQTWLGGRLPYAPRNAHEIYFSGDNMYSHKE